MIDSIVTPENTKKIATWMGLNIFDSTFISGSSNIYIEVLINDTYIKYSPATNAEQSREVEKKLLGLDWMLHTLEDSYVLLYQGVGIKGAEIIEESLSLAIYKAALHEAKK